MAERRSRTADAQLATRGCGENPLEALLALSAGDAFIA
jgi:hypothetical protein